MRTVMLLAPPNWWHKSSFFSQKKQKQTATDMFHLAPFYSLSFHLKKIKHYIHFESSIKIVKHHQLKLIP